MKKYSEPYKNVYLNEQLKADILIGAICVEKSVLHTNPHCASSYSHHLKINNYSDFYGDCIYL